MFENFFKQTKISPEKSVLFSAGNRKLKEKIQLVNDVKHRIDQNYTEKKHFELKQRITSVNADNPFYALDVLDNNARYMLFNDKNKSSNINILAWRLSKLSLEHEKAAAAYHEAANLNMMLSMRYYRLNLEYEAQYSALHASKYEALKQEYEKINASLEKATSKVTEISLLTLEVIYKDKYASLEAGYKEQYAALEKELIISQKKNEEWKAAIIKLTNEYNAVIDDYNEVIGVKNDPDVEIRVKDDSNEVIRVKKDYNEVIGVKDKDAAVLDYNNLLEKYTSLTSQHKEAVFKNKRYETYLDITGAQKLWNFLTAQIAQCEILTKNNDLLKKENDILHKDCSRAARYCESLMLENKKLKSLLEATSTSSEFLEPSVIESSEDAIIQMHEQTIINNDSSEQDNMLEETFDLLFGSV